MDAAKGTRMDGNRKREFKDTVYELFAGVGKALSSGRRLEVLDLLSQAERSVEELAAATGMTVANASRHLQVLRRAGLVSLRREGVRHLYRLAHPSVYELWAAVRDYAEAHVPEIDHVVRTYLEDRESLEAIGAEELRERLGDGQVVLLDVRPRREYEAGHIPGARCVPPDELDDALASLPADREIVAHCRGRYCVYSDEAVRRLRENGFRARRYEGNVRDWERSRRAG